MKSEQVVLPALLPAFDLELENAMRHGKLTYFDDDSRMGCYLWMGVIYFAEVEA